MRPERVNKWPNSMTDDDDDNDDDDDVLPVAPRNNSPLVYT
jgi:hypothetical protein